jgi:predicted transcriptional regulator
MNDSIVKKAIQSESELLLDICEGIAEGDKGEFASDEEVNAVFAKLLS